MRRSTKLVIAMLFLCTLAACGRTEGQMALETSTPLQTTVSGNELVNADPTTVKEFTSVETFSEALSVLIAEHPADEASGKYDSCRLLVSCEDEQMLFGLGAEVILHNPDDSYVLQFDSVETAKEGQLALTELYGVEYAEPDTVVSLCGNTTEALGYTPISWGTNAVEADQFARALSGMDYQPVTVAVVDTGIVRHELLEGRLVPGWDFVDGGAVSEDLSGHGTHVAGIIADATAGCGVYIMPVRAFEYSKGFISAICAAIRYAADNGADVINLSFGGDHTESLHRAIEYAEASGAIVIVAAGNEKNDTSSICPAHIEAAITVSAVDEGMRIYAQSNFGSAVDFTAPGVSIYSSVPDGYAYYEGTSMAAPYISAMAAMLRASGLAWTLQEVQQSLENCCEDLGENGRDDSFGAGLPVIGRLVRYLDTPTQEASEPDFDETYWILSFGQTLGGNFSTLFHADGSISLYNSGSGLFSTGSYEYADGIMYVSVSGDVNGQDSIVFVKKENEFVSMDKIGMQVGYDYYRISPDESKSYAAALGQQQTATDAKQTVLNALSYFLDTAERVLGQNIETVKSIYGEPENEYYETGILVCEFLDSSTGKAFKLEDYGDSVTFSMKLDDMGLTDKQTEALMNAVSSEFHGDSNLCQLEISLNVAGAQAHLPLCCSKWSSNGKDIVRFSVTN